MKSTIPTTSAIVTKVVFLSFTLFLSSCNYFKPIKYLIDPEVLKELDWWGWLLIILLAAVIIIAGYALIAGVTLYEALLAVLGFIWWLISLIGRLFRWIYTSLVGLLKELYDWIRMAPVFIRAFMKWWTNPFDTAAEALLKYWIKRIGEGLISIFIFWIWGRTRLTKLNCPETVTLTATTSDTDIETDYPFGKSAAQVRQDAIDNAESRVKQDLRNQLLDMTQHYSCECGNRPIIGTPNVQLVLPTSVKEYRSWRSLWLCISYEATATATGTITIDCK